MSVRLSVSVLSNEERSDILGGGLMSRRSSLVALLIDVYLDLAIIIHQPQSENSEVWRTRPPPLFRCLYSTFSNASYCNRPKPYSSTINTKPAGLASRNYSTNSQYTFVHVLLDTVIQYHFRTNTNAQHQASQHSPSFLFSFLLSFPFLLQ
jgi:hypothetical protein